MLNYNVYPYNLLTRYFIDIYQIDNTVKYDIMTLDAKDLIVPRRIDILAKWLLLDAEEKGENVDEYLELYKKHLDVWSKGTFIEEGSPEKNSFEKYLKAFHRIRDGIKEHGFNDKISIIPTGGNLEILDGSHRVSCAAYYNKNVTIIRFPSLSVAYNAPYFRYLGLDDNSINILTYKYCELKGNSYRMIAPSYNGNINAIVRDLSTYVEIIDYKDTASGCYFIFEAKEKRTLDLIRSNMAYFLGYDSSSQIVIEEYPQKL